MLWTMAVGGYDSGPIDWRAELIPIAILLALLCWAF